MNTTTITFGAKVKNAALITAAALQGPVASGLQAVGTGLCYGIVGGLTVFGVATGARLARKAYGEGGVGVGVAGQGSLGMSMSNDGAPLEAGPSEQIAFSG